MSIPSFSEWALDRDRVDLDAREVLAVTLDAPVLLPTLELSDHDLGAAAALEHRRGDLRVADERTAESDLAGIGDEVDLVERDLVPRLRGEERDVENRLRLGVPLLAGDGDDRVHGFLLGAPPVVGARARADQAG